MIRVASPFVSFLPTFSLALPYLPFTHHAFDDRSLSSTPHHTRLLCTAIETFNTKSTSRPTQHKRESPLANLLLKPPFPRAHHTPTTPSKFLLHPPPHSQRTVPSPSSRSNPLRWPFERGRGTGRALRRGARRGESARGGGRRWVEKRRRRRGEERGGRRVGGLRS